MKGGSRQHYPNGYNSNEKDQQRSNADEGHRYLLEHLATFSVGPEFGLTTPKDGLRRLLQMDKANGIWTQKMQMKLDKNWVIILDYEDGDIVERFPLNLISDPTAYTSDDPRELYNNILVFIVREDPKNNNNPSEMHIFQCAHVHAQDIVDEMKMFITGKMKTRYNDNVQHLPPPPHDPPPEPPVGSSNPSQVSIRDHVTMYSGSGSVPSSFKQASIDENYRERTLNLQSRNRQPQGSAAVFTHESADETSSTLSDKYEREVTILNHCFDDIERFVVRLQHAAAAYKELERRQKNRKHKKRDMGDGMLSIRAKPPPEMEFMDILQKFKLSFNLLAKLKSHIHDPNAPELVHFLFTPLALIVDAARDSNHSANLAARVVSPLLTRDAVELLINCCTSKETDLWHSLGDTWVITRDQWKGFEGSYHPVFSNGWTPENPVDYSPVSHKLLRSDHDRHEQGYHRLFGNPEREGHCDSDYFCSEGVDDQDCAESVSVIPDSSNLHPTFERQLNSRTSDQRRDLLNRGTVHLSESDYHDQPDRDIRSEFSSDSIEHSDSKLSHQQTFEHHQGRWLEDLKNRHAKIVQVVYPRTANNDKELTVIRGEILEILDDRRKWWKARNVHGQVAHVPHTIVTPYTLNEDLPNNSMYASRNSKESYYSSGISSGIKEHFIEDPSQLEEIMHNASADVTQLTPPDWGQDRQDINLVHSTFKSAYTEKQTDRLSMAETSSSTVHSLHGPIQDEISADKASPSSPISIPEGNSSNFPRQVISLGIDPERETGFQIQYLSNHPSKAQDLKLAPQSKSQQEFSSLEKENLQLSGAFEQNQIMTASLPKPEVREPPPLLLRQQNVKLGEAELPPEQKKSKDMMDTNVAQELLQDELRATVAQSKGKKVWKKILCPEHETPKCFYIDENSTKNDVKHWLQLKNFSERSQEVLKQMDGAMLFKAKQNQLECYLDEEGTHLYRLLTVQKNFSGFTTCSTKELKSILAMRRQKTDVNV